MTVAGEVPTGTVTCLFSDIEGSTRLELAVGTGTYREIRERHRALLRAAFGQHHGHEQGTEGDSFFVLFRRAGDAVAAAVAAQRALAAETWPQGVSVRVRMGLHTGEVEAVGDDVIGYAINRASRVAGAAHGGQILLSDATRALVADALPADVTFRLLGEHRLKDLREPERLAQLVVAGLPDAFPPPRSVDARPNNLPTQLTSFVGREHEVRETVELLGRTRLLSLIGPGGTGKTRLSLQIAAEVADRYPDGVWFVALDSVRDPALVIASIGRVLGVVDDPARPAIDAVADALGQRIVLLVLDNLEQVVDAAPDIADLLRRCPGLTCLVTTRIALRVSGEQEYPVPGLPTPPDMESLSEIERRNLPQALRELDVEGLSGFEAVRLFVARAGALRPGFAVTPENARAIAAITARLQGMPLAIELAAARTKLLTPEQILARLDHHLTVLTSGARDLPARQQTLRGAIAWSYDLLDEGGRRLLDRLSTFRGSFALETAERVCGPATEIDGDLVERLDELVAQSLVRLEEGHSEVRFALLETIREFAAEMLGARGETETIEARHGAAFLALAREAQSSLRGPDQRLWLDRLEREHDNIRAALDRATTKPDPALATNLAYATWRFWQQRGYLNEARMRLEAIAEAMDDPAGAWDLAPTHRARFAEAIGGVAYWQSQRDPAVRWYDEALTIWREQGDRAEIANALYNRSYADMNVVMGSRAPQASLDRSRRLLEEALAIYQDLGDRSGEANLTWGLGSLEYFNGNAQDAEARFRRSLELHRAAGDATMEAWSLHMLATSLTPQRRWDEARTEARHALDHFHAAGDVAGMTLVLDDLAIIALGEGAVQRASRLWGAARSLQASTGTGLADYVRQNQELYGTATPADSLPPETLDRFAAEGAAMGLDEVVAYALADDEPGLD